jgi:hypothetical protein
VERMRYLWYMCSLLNFKVIEIRHLDLTIVHRVQIKPFLLPTSSRTRTFYTQQQSSSSSSPSPLFIFSLFPFRPLQFFLSDDLGRENRDLFK